MDLAELKMAVKAGSIDTVLIGLTDMQGRLMGKRMHAAHFVDDVAEHGAEACNYLLAVDVEMNTVEGYAMSSWEQGYGDFVLKPDLDTLIEVPWQEATALVLCDLQWHDGRPIVASPRQILRAQLERLEKLGWTAQAGTELEFLVFEDSYEEAWDRKYTGLTPSNRYNVDYSMMGTAKVEPLLRRIRNSMYKAGMQVEDSKGECNFGQHEINFRYSDALTSADRHVIYKNGAKEIAAQEEMAISFMPKYDEREGNSCHVHLSITDDKGKNVFEGDKAIFDSFIAGLLDSLRELTVFLAPNINSYKRFAAGSFAPTTVAWGEDNVPHGGTGSGPAVGCRAPGADVNPYLVLAALIAGGLHGVEHKLELEPMLEGSGYAADDKPQLPRTLHEARDLLAGSKVAKEAFGEEVIDHYLNMARVEIETFDAAITDWERVRGFERL